MEPTITIAIVPRSTFTLGGAVLGEVQGKKKEDVESRSAGCASCILNIQPCSTTDITS